MDRRSASPNPASALRHHQSLTKPRPISSFTPSQLSHNPSSTSTSNKTSNSTLLLNNPHSIPIPSLQALSLLPPLPTLNNTNHLLPTTKSTLVDVVVEGMGGGMDPGEGWQVPPELVFFLRSLGERLDPFSPTGGQPSASSGSLGHTKSLTAALNHATSRPTTDQPAIMALFNELVSTERTYLKRISALNQSYAAPLKNFSKSSHTKIIDKYEATSMFGKIEAVVTANSSLLSVLETCLSMLEHDPRSGNWAAILSNELLNIQRPYRDYLSGYDIIKETEQKLLKKSEGFRQFCERTKEAMYDDGMGRVGLRELLMEPVQRVTRYILIFEQMLKKMSSNDQARSGLLACIATCNRLAICELDDHLIKAATMWGLHRSIDHFPPILVKPGRYFIDAIDVLDIIPDTANPTILHCTLFLFNDTIVIAKKPPNGHLTGKTLAGLDDLDRLVAAMKKSKGTTSGLNSVVSGGTDFFSKSLGGHNTPTKLKKGSMRFKGLIDVHDVIVANEPGQTGSGSAAEVSFDLYLDRPPQDVSERWTERRYRHYVVCPPPTPPLTGHEKSLSLSSHPTSTHPPISVHQTSHSLAHKSHLNLHSGNQHAAALAERDRFLDNLRKSQALVKAADDRSTVMRTKFVNEDEGQGAIDSFWNLYDKQTYLTEQRKHRVALQLVGTDSVDPLQFNTESIDAAPPLMIIRAHFNDPDDPDCRIHVRRKPNHVFPCLNASIDKAEEDIVVQTERLCSLIVQIIQAYGIADIPPRSSFGGGLPSASTQQQHFNGVGNPPSPSRGFRNKSGSLSHENVLNNALPHRIFGTNNPNHGIHRVKSSRSSNRLSATISQPGTPSSVPLREVQPGMIRSPGGPVWYRNGSAPVGLIKTEKGATAFTAQTDLPPGGPGGVGPHLPETNQSLYDDLPRLREEQEEEESQDQGGHKVGLQSSSPTGGSTLRGKGKSTLEDSEEDPRGDEGGWNGAAETESQCSSVSRLSSHDFNEEEGQEGRVKIVSRTRGGLVGPRQLVSSSHLDCLSSRAVSEPPGKEGKLASVGGYRFPERERSDRTDSSDRLHLISNTGLRNVSGSSLGKRSRSAEVLDPLVGEGQGDGADYHHRDDRAKRIQTLPLVVRKSTADSKKSIGDRPNPSSDLYNENLLNGPQSRSGLQSPKQNFNAKQSADNYPEKLSSSVDSCDLASNLTIKDLGTNQLFQDMKSRMKVMRNQLKKLKNEIHQIDNNHQDLKNNLVGGSANVITGGSSRIPRSPRKLHLSEAAKSAADALTSPTKKQGGFDSFLVDLEKTLDGLDRKLGLLESVESKSFKNFQDQYFKTFERMKKEIKKKENELKISIDQERVNTEIRTNLEVENNHLYDAFNEELDKMFNDIQLPPSQSLNILIEDLKKLADEKGKLITQLGSTQRQLELEVAKSDCLESLLREAGLLT